MNPAIWISRWEIQLWRILCFVNRISLLILRFVNLR